MNIQLTDIRILILLAAAVIAVTAVLFLMRRRRPEYKTASQSDQEKPSGFRITEKIIVTHTDEAVTHDRKGDS